MKVTALLATLSLIGTGSTTPPKPPQAGSLSPRTAASPKLTYFDLSKAESFGPAQSWNEQSDRETEIIPSAVSPSRVAVIARALYLWLVFTPLLSTALPAAWSPAFRCNLWYPLVCWTLARGGAAWIKWAQWASTRPDILPEQLCAQLAKLQTAAPAHSYAYTKQEVENTFGRALEEVFQDFSENPVASGSIAQVHFARYEGEKVAVKVRHPNVAKQLSIDFRIMRWAADVVSVIPGLSWLNLRQSVEAFSHTMTGQTLLDVEGNHLALFNHNFRTWDDVKFPKPIVSSEAVLVESFMEGRLVSDFIGFDDVSLVGDASGSGASAVVVRGRLPLEVAHFVVTRGEDLYLQMLLVDGLMHADLHPGNILVTMASSNSGTVSGKTQITLVDAGMVASLKPSEQKHFVGLLACMGEGDGDGAAAHVLAFSDAQTCASEACRAEFRLAMRDLFMSRCRGYGTNIDLALVLRGVLSLVREHGVRIDVNYATLVMNALCLDGLANALLPDYNIMDAAAPLLRAYAKLESFTSNGKAEGGKGNGLLKSMGIPIAMKRKRKHDAWVNERLARIDPSDPGALEERRKLLTKTF
mmetsp:Transcript_48893/g.110964  ORF Transcript_48893/g.110964 Transcript_48893/m.110964 type:complete len:584 (-) Transcript_48893:241-1992(-)